jgi:DNA-binding NtrC family response regulator
LIVDDSEVCRAVLAILLKNTGFEVTSVVDGREALTKLREEKFDLVLLDNEMPELGGLETLAALRDFEPELPVVIVSGTLSPELRGSYEEQGIEAIYDKPVDPRKLRDLIPAVLERCKKKAEDVVMEQPVFEGGSVQVRKLARDFGRIMDFNMAATISGGPGSAFIDVAAALAEEKDAMLLACAASAVSAERLMKLFATGFAQKRSVLLAILGAEKLDASQQDLLDGLIGGDGVLAGFNRRGRVILCAEASLTDLADAGEFSEMLLMRAGTMKLAIPSLAQRREDLPQIARAVLRRVGAPAVTFTSEALEWLEKGDWPGDYLQLHRTVEIARCTRPDAVELDVKDLEQALALEPGWSKPLYHDVFLRSLSGE